MGWEEVSDGEKSGLKNFRKWDKTGQVIASTPGIGASKQANFLLGRSKTAGNRVQDIIKAGFGTDAEYNA